jgi:hypothetical protein
MVKSGILLGKWLDSQAQTQHSLSADAIDALRGAFKGDQGE